MKVGILKRLKESVVVRLHICLGGLDGVSVSMNLVNTG